MSRNLSTILSPSTFLDPSPDCNSEPGTTDYSPPTGTYPFPFAIESDDYRDVNFTGGFFEHSDSTMSRSQSMANTNVITSGSTFLDPSRLQAIALLPPAPGPGKKSPRPTLPSPVNISVYTKQAHFSQYITSVLTPSTKHIARSSLTAVVDLKTYNTFHKTNVGRFANLVTYELEQQCTDVSETWVRDILFNMDGLFTEPFGDIVEASTVWNKSQSFAIAPPAFVEDEMVTWLNDISDRLAKSFSGKHSGSPATQDRCQRKWSDRTANASPTGATQSRKPDLALFAEPLWSTFDKRGKEYKPGWETIKAFVELSQTSNKIPGMLPNIVEKCHLMFETQPFRKFVIVLVFSGSGAAARWALVLVDRSGVMSTIPMALDGGGGVTLARVLYCLSIGPPHRIGIDETMTIDEMTGIVTHITVTGQTPTSKPGKPVTFVFEIVRLIHSPSQISGRATRVWLVRLDDEYYILKDSWPLKSKPFSEIRHLLKINQTIMGDEKMRDTLRNTYPIFVVGQEFDDSTASHRRQLSLTSLSPLTKPRLHRRIVTKPIGDPLTSFSSKLELCRILCDVVRCKYSFICPGIISDSLILIDLDYSTKHCRVCHGDISLTNIVINRMWEDDDDDDDNAKEADKNMSDVDNSRSGANIIADSASLHQPPALNHSNSVVESAATFSSSVLPPVPTVAHGVVIDYDNSFSLEEGGEDGYRVNSVR